MSKAKTYTPKRFTRQLTEKINALEGLHMSEKMKARFAEFDAQELSGDERRAQLLAHFKIS